VPRLERKVAASWVTDTLTRLTIGCPAEIRAAAEVLREAGAALGNLCVEACSNIASKAPMLDGEGCVLSFGARHANDDAECGRHSRSTLTPPLMLVCRYESEPFLCDARGIHTQQANPSLAALDLSDFFARHGQVGVIVVPVHLPYGRIGAATFRSSKAGGRDLTDQFSRYGDLLGLFARKFIASYVKAMEKEQWNPSDHLLSKREIECLRWAAVGKTDSQIASILSRSCATVRFHIHNACIKLNAVNRCQTVFKAGQLGYLDH
jgi:LuxR family transcriptional regulator, quorum-sensing system regulator CciR